MEFKNVTAHAEANVYFDGKVISHTIITEGGERKTLGVMLPGTYHFGTEAAELMEIVAGQSSHKLDDSEDTQLTSAGESFNVAANSGFTITVEAPTSYVCSFLS